MSGSVQLSTHMVQQQQQQQQQHTQQPQPQQTSASNSIGTLPGAGNNATIEKSNNLASASTASTAPESMSTQVSMPMTKNNLDIIQDMIDLWANHLDGLRTQCVTSAVLTQQEIRNLESKLVRHFSELLLTKARMNERIPANGLPHTTGNELKQWLRVVGLSQESMNVCLTRLSTLEQLLDQSDEELKQMLCNNPNYREEEVRRLTKAMHNLRKCKELLSKDGGGAGGNANDNKEQVDQWFWDSWDRHNHVHRGSIGNIGLTTASPRAPHRQHGKHQSSASKLSSNAAIISSKIASHGGGRQSPTNENQQATNNSNSHSHSSRHDATNSSNQGSTLTLTLTPSPPNSPFANSISGTGALNVKGTPQRSRNAGTPPPIRKHQTMINSNITPTHIVNVLQEPIDKLEITQTVMLQHNAINSGGPRARLPTDPSPDSISSASSDIFIEHNNNSNTLLVPCSPGAGHVGMGHAIPHRFTKLNFMSTCNLCQKQMFMGLKCKDCKYRCHRDCEPHVPPSCRLPREYVDEFIKQTFNNDQVGSLPHNQSGGSPSSKKITLTKPRQHGDSSSPSSSCTSSTPSSPALFHLQQQHHMNYMGSGIGSNSISNASTTNNTNALPTPSSQFGNKHQTSQFNFPDVTITTTMSNSNYDNRSGNNTQTILYAAQLQANEQRNCAPATDANNTINSSGDGAISTSYANQQIKLNQHTYTNSSSGGVPSNDNNCSNHMPNNKINPNNSAMNCGGNGSCSGNDQASGNNGHHCVAAQQQHSSAVGVSVTTCNNATTYTSSLVSTNSGTFYQRKLSSAGVEQRMQFTSEMSDTHKSNDSDKTVSLSGSTSASTDSDRTPVRLDSTEDGDSGHWPRQNSLSLKEWDIPYGDLELLEQIGKGRFGTVHRALWHGDVAVKLLKEDYLDDEQMLEAFKLEVANFKKTRHENLVLFMGACMNPPYLAIVTSLCKGNTLYTYIHQRREKFAINRTLLIAQQIAQGMGYLHARGIVHKDLRTKNIFIENGKVIITDFGLFSSTKLFYCDIGLGIPHNWLCYIAPELMRALMPRKPNDECLPFSPGSDVYSFGTVWYELICGEFTFKDQPAESIIWQVGRGMKQTLANLQSGRDVKDLLMLCWSYEAENRPDFARLLQLLEHLPKKRLARSPSHPVNLSRSAESVF